MIQLPAQNFFLKSIDFKNHSAVKVEWQQNSYSDNTGGETYSYTNHILCHADFREAIYSLKDSLENYEVFSRYKANSIQKLTFKNFKPVKNDENEEIRYRVDVTIQSSQMREIGGYVDEESQESGKAFILTEEVKFTINGSNNMLFTENASTYVEALNVIIKESYLYALKGKTHKEVLFSELLSEAS